MKRLLLSAVAAVTFVSPLGVTAAQARDNDRGWYQDRDRNGDRDRDWRRDHDRRGDWDGRRFDRGRHNGYYYQNRWYYGPPPSAYYGRPGFRVDYRQWRRGEYLPSYYRSRYEVVDYRYHHLRPPPRGYHYVRDDRGDIILAAIATGLIASIILNN